MFIKLTRPDGRPIWLNSAFVVTVEPKRDGGSIVVPIGDGLDYDVREAPEAVLAMLDGVPSPTVVPVPSKDALKAASETPLPENAEEPVNAPDAKKAEAEKKPAAKKTTTRKRTTRKTAASAEKPADEKAKAAEKPAEGAVGAAPPETPVPPVEPEAKAEAPVVVENSEAMLGFDESEIERLRKMAPKSIRKLRNTLAAQFTSGDVNQTIRALEMRGVLAVVRDHVEWK